MTTRPRNSGKVSSRSSASDFARARAEWYFRSWIMVPTTLVLGARIKVGCWSVGSAADESWEVSREGLAGEVVEKLGEEAVF